MQRVKPKKTFFIELFEGYMFNISFKLNSRQCFYKSGSLLHDMIDDMITKLHSIDINVALFYTFIPKPAWKVHFSFKHYNKQTFQKYYTQHCWYGIIF